MSLEVCNVGTEIFLNTVLAVGSTYAALLDTGMEALDGLEMETVDIGLAEFEFTDAFGGAVDVVCEY